MSIAPALPQRPTPSLGSPSAAAVGAFRGAPLVVKPSVPADASKMWKAARDFEAMALGELLKPMFETVESKRNPFKGGTGEKTWKPMLVDEIAKQMAKAGGLGLAAPVHAAMLRMKEGKK